jgi:hypothetical protein
MPFLLLIAIELVTGRIMKGFSQLVDSDGGGQYDSSGGAGGKGNPQGSVCTGCVLTYT